MFLHTLEFSSDESNHAGSVRSLLRGCARANWVDEDDPAVLGRLGALALSCITSRISSAICLFFDRGFVRVSTIIGIGIIGGLRGGKIIFGYFLIGTVDGLSLMASGGLVSSSGVRRSWIAGTTLGPYGLS